MLPIDVQTLRLFLHVLAATIWVGGQLTLAALLPVLRRAGADVPRQAARQFGRVAWTAFAVLLVTGIWNVAEYDDKDASGYDTTLVVKLVLVTLSGVAAYVHSNARSRAVLAIGGAATGLFALAALFFGIVLAG
jgi:putative copper export protein